MANMAAASRLTGAFHSVTRWSLYLLVFLVPLFFLATTTEIFEINKQIVLVILTALATVTWLGGMVLGRTLMFRTGWLNLLGLLFFIGVLLSSLFSLAGYQTWVGQASQEYTSFLTVSSLILLFYLLMNVASETAVQRKMLCAFMLSAGLAGLVTLLGMFNLWHLPFDFAQSVGFNTVGTINAFAVFMTIAMFVGLAMWQVANGAKDPVMPEGAAGVLTRVLVFFNTVVALLVLAAIDFWVFWVFAIVGVVLLAIFPLVQTKQFPHPKRFLLPLGVFAVSVALLFYQTPLQMELPVVVTPSYQTSWSLAQQALSGSTTNLLFGTGPGTFSHVYKRYKPVEVNATLFWNVGFDRSKSHVLTSLTTFGVLTTALALLFMLLLGLRALGRLLFERNSEEWRMTYIFFVGWALLALTHIMYSSNFTLHFLFWAFSGLLASQVVGKLWQKSFAQAKKLSLVFSAAFVVLAVAVIVSVFVGYQRYRAELAFANAVRLDQAGAPMSDVIRELVFATEANGLSDVYYRNLSNALLLQAGEVIQSAEGQLSDEQSAQVAQLVSTAVNAANTSTDIEPNNVLNWSARGAIYRDVMSFVGNAEDFAAATFTQAAGLEPANPIHYASLGRVHLSVATRAAGLLQAEDQALREQAAQAVALELQNAERAFVTAANLKPDYGPAHYYLAVVYEAQGRLPESAQRLAVLHNNNPTDIGIAFQLAMMLLRMQDLDNAKTMFERVLALDPDYSNALWFVASVHELQGNPQAALQAVERVAQLNPDNELVSSRLARMRAGEITTFVPQPPVEEGAEVSATEVEGGPVTEEGDGGAEDILDAPVDGAGEAAEAASEAEESTTF